MSCFEIFYVNIEQQHRQFTATSGGPSSPLRTGIQTFQSLPLPPRTHAEVNQRRLLNMEDFDDARCSSESPQSLCTSQRSPSPPLTGSTRRMHDDDVTAKSPIEDDLLDDSLEV